MCLLFIFLCFRVAIAGLKVCKQAAPHIEYAILVTDGAGCFNSTEFTAGVALLGRLTGIFVRAHMITEAGCGKSRLDGHFPFFNAHCAKVVREGRGQWDITNAKQCAQALAQQGGLKNTISVHLQFMRDPERKSAALKIESFPTLEKYSQRNYIYEADGQWSSLELHMFSAFRDTPDLVLLPTDILKCFPEGERTSARTYNNNNFTIYDASPELQQAQPTYTTQTNPTITNSDRERARVHQQQRAEAKASAAASHTAELAATQQLQRARSQLYHCSIPGCCYKVQSKAWFLKHSALPASEHAVRKLTTDKDDIITMCAESVTDTKYSASLATVLNPDRVDTCTDSLALLPLLHLSDGVTVYDPKESRFTPGWAYKSSAKPQYSNAKIIEFMIYLQQRGTDGGTNTIASDAVQAMRWKGTMRGAEIFTNTATDLATMLPNDSNVREFKIGELRDCSQIKKYLREPLEELQKTLDGLKKKETAAAARQADPLLGALHNLTRQQLNARLNKFKKNHTELELVEPGPASLIESFCDPTTTPAQMRELLHRLVVQFGRTEEDLSIFV